MFTRCFLGSTAPVGPRLRSTNLPAAMSVRRSGLSPCESDEVVAVEGLFMSVGLAHRNDANVVLSFGGDDGDERIVERPERHAHPTCG
jgi:hypothetical protein